MAIICDPSHRPDVYLLGSLDDSGEIEQGQIEVGYSSAKNFLDYSCRLTLHA